MSWPGLFGRLFTGAVNLVAWRELLADDFDQVKRAALNLAVASDFPVGEALDAVRRAHGEPLDAAMMLRNSPAVRAWVGSWASGERSIRRPRRRKRRA